MNASAPYAPPTTHHGYVEQPHLPSHGHTPVSNAHYPQYAPQQPMLPSAHYAAHSNYYTSYPTPSPQSGSHTSSQYSHHQPVSLPAMSPSSTAPNTSHNMLAEVPQDQTGQKPPPGVKPKVTATLWEDEGTLCFQVEAKGICVARREDNHMINGTKLLNVAGMTRGRRDGILKSEKTRNVVKIGPMHLKGVWIPYEQALKFANQEKITDQLYPLFVHNIGALLHHPSNQTSNMHQRRAEVHAQQQQQQQQQQSQSQTQKPASTSQAPPAPPLVHSQSVASGVSQHGSQVPTHSSAGRPALDRAHTFPTPPTTASGVMGMHNTGYEWSGHGATSVPTTQSLAIDTSNINNPRSMPTTPASTPPGASMHAMHQYQTPQYDPASRHNYGTTSHGGYQYPQTVPSHGDYSTSHTGYAPERHAYAYSSNPAPGQLPSEHLTPEAKPSPQHVGSGRATPRTIANPGSQWQQGSYSTPQRTQTLPSNHLSYVTSEARAPASQPNGYASSASLPSSAPPPPYQYSNGPVQSQKRGRDDYDDDRDPYSRPPSGGPDGSLKRRRTAGDVGPASINRSVVAQAR